MKDNKTKKIIRYTFLLGLFLVVLGTSYALFTITLTGNKLTRIKSANVSLQLLDENNNSIEKTDNNSYEYEINIDKAVPISDEEGLAGESFKFKLKNNGSIPTKYSIYLDDVALTEGEQRLANEYLRYQLIKNNEEEYYRAFKYLGESPNRILDGGIINKNETIEYELRIWLDKNADNDAINKVFDTVLRVEGLQYNGMNIKEGTLANTIVSKGIVANINKVYYRFDTERESDGLYEYTDNQGTKTYVFRGSNPNNYIEFAGSTWRILRIGEEGEIKIIKAATGNEMYIPFNTEHKSNAHRFEGSNVEAYLNEWYTTELEDYDSRILRNNYCSDTSVESRDDYPQYDYYSTIFNGPKLWLSDNNNYVKPSISCRSQDIVNSKIALITLDEFILAGGSNILGRVGGNGNTYVKPKYTYEQSWTMSPIDIHNNSSNTNIRYSIAVFDGYGQDNGMSVTDNNCNVRPVITLKSNVTVSSGNGTEANPYVIDN